MHNKDAIISCATPNFDRRWQKTGLFSLAIVPMGQETEVQHSGHWGEKAERFFVVIGIR